MKLIMPILMKQNDPPLQETDVPQTVFKATIKIASSGMIVNSAATPLKVGSHAGTGAPDGIPHQVPKKTSDRKPSSAARGRSLPSTAFNVSRITPRASSCSNCPRKSSVSTETGGMAFFPKSIEQIDEIAAEVARDIRNQYTLGYHSTKPTTEPGFRRVQVTAEAKGMGKLTVRTRTGYFPVVHPVGKPAAPAQR